MVHGLAGDGPPKPGIHELVTEYVNEYGLIPMSVVASVEDIETMADEWEGPIHRALIPAALLLALYANDPQLVADWFEFTRDNDGDITSSPR